MVVPNVARSWCTEVEGLKQVQKSEPWECPSSCPDGVLGLL